MAELRNKIENKRGRTVMENLELAKRNVMGRMNGMEGINGIGGGMCTILVY